MQILKTIRRENILLAIIMLLFSLEILTLKVGFASKKTRYLKKFKSINTIGPEYIYLLDSYKFVDTIYGSCGGGYVGAGYYNQNGLNYNFKFVNYEENYTLFRPRIDTTETSADTLQVSVEFGSRYNGIKLEGSFAEINYPIKAVILNDIYKFKVPRAYFPLELKTYNDIDSRQDTVYILMRPANYHIQRPETSPNWRYSTEADSLRIQQIKSKGRTRIYEKSGNHVEFIEVD